MYADALEWDYDGHILVYDCFNRIQNNDGQDIEYWDVNFIQVWDNESNDFGNGTIAKLFASLPDGVNIGNPSFSKISPNIIAFDYFDLSSEEYAVLGYNIETNEVNIITANNSLGWPSYNKNDSRIAFTLMDGEQYTSNYINLNTDKISSSTEKVALFTDAKWPVYFASGDRKIGDQVITAIVKSAEEKTSLTCYPTVFKEQLTLEFNRELVLGSNVELFNPLTQRAYTFNAPSSKEKSMVLDLGNIHAGIYILRISNAPMFGSCRVIKR